MRIFGIDPSSKRVVICMLDTELDPEGFHAFADMNIAEIEDFPERCAETHFTAMNVLHEMSEGNPFYVFVEQPLVGRAGVKSTLVQAYIHGILLGAAVSSGAKGVYQVNVQTWKKAVVGRGNASKSDVRAWLGRARTRLSDAASASQDHADAACIALYGRDVQARSDRVVGSRDDEPGVPEMAEES